MLAFNRHLLTKNIWIFEGLLTLDHTHMDSSSENTNKGAQWWERGANEPSELNDMLPKQKHTFVILFPWSALWLMFCQFRALGSVHSNCQGHKAGGSGECRMTDVTGGWIKKVTVCVWYLLGGGGFYTRKKRRASSHASGAISARIPRFSAWDLKTATFF